MPEDVLNADKFKPLAFYIELVSKEIKNVHF